MLFFFQNTNYCCRG